MKDSARSKPGLVATVNRVESKEGSIDTDYAQLGIGFDHEITEFNQSTISLSYKFPYPGIPETKLGIYPVL